MESFLYSFWVAPIHIGSLSLRAPWSSDSDRAARNPQQHPNPTRPCSSVQPDKQKLLWRGDSSTSFLSKNTEGRRPHSCRLWEAGATLRGWPDLVSGPPKRNSFKTTWAVFSSPARPEPLKKWRNGRGKAEKRHPHRAEWQLQISLQRRNHPTCNYHLVITMTTAQHL